MRHLLLIAVFLAFPLHLLAGEIAGVVFIREHGESRPLEGAEVIVACEDASSATATSTRGGFYRVLGPGVTGRCDVSVGYDGLRSNTISVMIAGDTSVALVIEQIKDRLQLRKG
jgi:hypothetical protein